MERRLAKPPPLHDRQFSAALALVVVAAPVVPTPPIVITAPVVAAPVVPPPPMSERRAVVGDRVVAMVLGMHAAQRIMLFAMLVAIVESLVVSFAVLSP